MRAGEFISEEQQLDEILPLIIGAARGAAAIGGAAAKVAGKVGGAVTRGVVGAAGAAGRMAGKQMGSAGAVQATPNKVVGTQSNPNTKTSDVPPTPSTRRPTIAPDAQDTSAQVLANLKPGVNLQLPTGTGKMGNFKISKVMGTDVEIENPDKNKNPNEPDKLVYNRDDLIKSLGTK